MAERLIHILPETVASQIAAGEVVERPASAVKELVENALDAGARSVSVELAGGGSRLLAVSDDGCGMMREDACLALRRHATSKIRDAADLTAIRTLGFRGEALASIASVARLELSTRRPADPAGVRLSAVGGNLTATAACAMAPGTRVEVRDLFFNTPARLKFLKTVATEQGAVAEAIQRLALAWPAVAFSLSADGRSLFELAPARSRLERIRQLFGGKLADRMLPFSGAQHGISAGGFATVSQDSFPTPRMVFTFVNRRAVRDRLLLRAIGQAYATLLPRGRHPGAVVLVEMRAEEVDVNVHPMKTEVRFRRAGEVFEVVYHALRARLADQSVTAMEGGAAQGNGAPTAGGAAQPARPQPAPALRLVVEAPSPALAQRPLGLSFTAAAPAGAAAAPTVGRQSAPEAGAIPHYSRLRVLGQLFAGYIVLESDDGLIVVDQHAAHERVTFEKLRAELNDGGIRIQPRLVPETLELNPARAGQIRDALAQLRALGFEVEAFGPAALVVKGGPAVFGSESGARLLADLIDSVGEVGLGGRGESAFEDLLKSLACHGSVRVGRTLEEREIRQLLEDLDRTEFKSNCPHGRPVHIRFARGQIERMFRR